MRTGSIGVISSNLKIIANLFIASSHWAKFGPWATLWTSLVLIFIFKEDATSTTTLFKKPYINYVANSEH